MKRVSGRRVLIRSPADIQVQGGEAPAGAPAGALFAARCEASTPLLPPAALSDDEKTIPAENQPRGARMFQA